MQNGVNLGVNGGPAMEYAVQGPTGQKVTLSEQQAIDLLTLSSLAAVLGPRLAGPLLIISQKTNAGVQVLTLAREKGLTGVDLKNAQDFAKQINHAEQQLIPMLKASSRQSFLEMEALAKALATNGYELTYWAPLYRGALYLERGERVPVEEDVLTVALDTISPTDAQGKPVRPKAILDLTKLTRMDGREVLKQFIEIYERLRGPVLTPLAGGAKVEILSAYRGLSSELGLPVPGLIALAAIGKVLIIATAGLIVWFSGISVISAAIPELSAVLKELARAVLAELASGIKWLLILGGIGIGIGTILLAPSIIEKFESTYLKGARIPAPPRGTVPVPVTAAGGRGAGLPVFV